MADRHNSISFNGSEHVHLVEVVRGFPDRPGFDVHMSHATGEQLVQVAFLGELCLLGVSEFAQTLGVSRQRVSKMAQTDKVPAPFARSHALGPLWLPIQVTQTLETRHQTPK